MSQRVFVNITRMAAGNEFNPNTIAVSADANYVDTLLNVTVNKGIGVNVNPDSSPREILNLLVLEAVVQQPVGFTLIDRNVIISSLDRG